MKKISTKGFTLIEVILSILLLGIITISVLPMAIHSVKYTKWNNIRLTSLNLAYSQVEWLKTLDYDDLGLDITGYSPKGIVQDNYYMNNTNTVIIQGVEYEIQTGIYWENADSITGEPVLQAMKKIDVVVEAKDSFTGEIREFSVLGSLVSREGERIPTKPGHVKVYVSLRGDNEAIKNVRVGLGSLSPTTWYANTDDNGIALIGDLQNGIYKVQPTKWRNQDMMVMPNGVNDTNSNWKLDKEVTVPKWDKDNRPEYPEVSFKVDLPGFIKLPINNKYPGSTRIEIKPTSSSYTPPEGQDDNDILLRTSIDKLNKIMFWRLWSYDYSITNGEERYYFVKVDTGNLWDGRFDIDNLDKPTNEELELAFGLENNSTFKTVDSGTNQVTEIIIKFSSQVKSIEDIEFALNGEIIDRRNYSITQEVPGKNNAFRILVNSTVNISGSTVDLQVINIEDIVNNYGMRLSRDLNRCTLVRNN